MQAGARKRVIWVVNSACPSRCVYCDIESQRATKDLSRDEVVLAAREVLSAGFDEVTFVGGEPLVYQWLPSVLEVLRGHCEVALFTGGLSGDSKRWIDLLRQGVTRLVLSIDEGSDHVNDVIRGRPGTTRDLLSMATSVREHLPHLDLSVSTVVTRHNAPTVESVWERMGAFNLTAWALVLAGDNFTGTPSEHFLSRAQVENFYLRQAPALARRIASESPDADFLIFPVPLPFLEGTIPVSRWDDPAIRTSEVEQELARYCQGDYNHSFVERYGCPLLGTDITLGVGGEVYPCSQAPIIKPDYVLGRVHQDGLAALLDGNALRSFAKDMPHSPCSRCWAPSNVPSAILSELIARRRSACPA